MHKITIIVIAILAAVGAVYAESLPSTTQQTSIAATVCDQCTVTVPATVSFQVDDVTQDTVEADNSITVDDIVLEDGKIVRIEIQADAASFTPPTGATVTWDAGDVSWNAASWTGGTGASGTLSSAAYTKVADSDANAAEVSTVDLDFTLADKATVDHAGDYSLTATWKFTSLVP